jgi:hypothetical protein
MEKASDGMGLRRRPSGRTRLFQDLVSIFMMSPIEESDKPADGKNQCRMNKMTVAIDAAAA